MRIVFIGDASLLISCVDSAVQSGFACSAVVTRNKTIAEWAKKADIRLLDKDADWEPILLAEGYDVVMSVANLDMLSIELIRAARHGAFNFHDGPLPRYAGLNATSWGLIGRELRHGITWHAMTERPDDGAIVEQDDFALDEHETALSLNAKCYEAGHAAFERLLRNLSAGTLSYRPQIGARTYFGRFKRPSAAATLDFTLPADDIVALVRALDLGDYANPLGSAKIVTGGRVLHVASAGVLAADDRSAPPGVVLSSDETMLVVATATVPVCLEQMTCSLGRPISPSAVPALNAGNRIMPVDAATLAVLDHACAGAARSERFWLTALDNLDVGDLPLPASRTIVSRDRWTKQILASRLDVDHKIAAMAAWARLISNGPPVSLAYASAQAMAALGPAAPWFKIWRPLTLDIAATASATSIADAVARMRGAIDAEGPIATDIALRRERKSRPTSLPEDLKIAVAVATGDDVAAAHGADVLVRLAPDEEAFVLETRDCVLDRETAAVIATQLGATLRQFEENPSRSVSDLAVHEAYRALEEPLGPVVPSPVQGLIDTILWHARLTPDRVALRTRWEALSFDDLARNVDGIAAKLAARGVGPGKTVGVCIERSTELVLFLLAVLRSGAAYLPLDPDYPASRIEYMLKDSGADLLITSPRAARKHAFAHRSTLLTKDIGTEAADPTDWTPPTPQTDAVAYLIYTSGSTGQPKGVEVSYGALANFMAGMDQRIPHDVPGTWLAVTSPNFDISILELFWTLSHGFTVALHGAKPPITRKAGPSFSLFFFAAAAPDADDPYRLLLESVKYGDANGFEAVWTPERHFHAFGAPYPNPAVTAAAIAATSSRIKIRAGSCVLPLHHPIRVVEDWSVVDVMSKGRVGLAFASGWQPNDFVLAPDTFDDRKNVMLSRVEDVRRLWRGEAVEFAGPNGKVATRTLPRPIQQDVPVWLTAAKNPETFETAGDRGYNVLTHMLGMTLAEVAENISRYRAAWRKAGHPGQGHVTLMLHTFVGDDDASVREQVRKPMKDYLRSAVDLVRDAAWSFPTIVDRANRTGRTPSEVFASEPLTGEELDALLDHAFSRYYETSGLFGSAETCLATVSRIAAIGVDEIACLIDFGVPVESALDQLPRLKNVLDGASNDADAFAVSSVADDMLYFGATHLQCTPSMATMIIEDRSAREALPRLEALLIGGEALSSSLARDLKAISGPETRLFNMYGPTETTIWSSVAEMSDAMPFAPLGQPIVNTELRIVKANGEGAPVLVPGELWIGGAGVAKGYRGRPELTAERFIERDGTRYYRTGDLVRAWPGGDIEFLGRIDNQVKIRGHRIELGEIERALETVAGISQAVVVARDERFGGQRLVAYLRGDDHAARDPDGLRAALASTLPEIMIPSAFVHLAAFPLTPNGKVDRKALPDPIGPRADAASPESAPPGSALEEKIASIWCELLDLSEVSVTQNFFDLGGHSLLAVQVQRRLSTLVEHRIGLTDVFRFPTIRSLASHLGGKTADTAAADAGRARASARLRARGRGRPTVLEAV